ncbi:group III truncated hemoglobin [Sphingomonas sp. H39-1-10]|uniref:group III truncated hemoglobin n=1 Tax=Sphingomonas TaxID=13687 RepID=UPI000883F066|nr:MULTISPECIES: group III truncated hemoglobin [Sphingomonas]MDF0489943.1 group III truncated hemoglobin [Sphingomonas pollutisoli]SDA36938.1 hemoglobin [Sphingomonas sp. NFR15]
MGGAKLEESEIRPVVERFYDRVRADEALGPVFGAAVHDWDDHHARLADFWSSVMLTSGRYKGNPVALHLRHADALTPAAFARWLTLWAQTTDEMLPHAVAQAMQAKAARIAESLQLAIQYRRTAA